MTLKSHEVTSAYLKIHLIDRFDTMAPVQWVWSSLSVDLIAKASHKMATSQFAADICVLPCVLQNRIQRLKKQEKCSFISVELSFHFVLQFFSPVEFLSDHVWRQMLTFRILCTNAHNRNEINYAHRLTEMYKWLEWHFTWSEKIRCMFCFTCGWPRVGVGHTATQYECKWY